MPTGTKPGPNDLDRAIAEAIRSAMAGRTPPLRQADIERMTQIPQSSLSRLLKPAKTMTIQQLDEICSAVGIDAAVVLGDAMRTVAAQQALVARSSRTVPARQAHEPSRSRAPRGKGTSRASSRH
ncbi:hypothetical protein GCM10025864_39080 [Luteimicrobium album]|uniref:HTH cro/C1-type domain-containing protein n=1 Tax=Luteimicrobium album TaxID=1054550 RepID=A0ABQ6I8U6_9MICO|nr:helix-turn-helix transcriptional regulator [Luteimicrobium album]GMA26149.1 hypothetical protein GCM10025864_39080 [Luteimicrobium album]